MRLRITQNYIRDKNRNATYYIHYYILKENRTFSRCTIYKSHISREAYAYYLRTETKITLSVPLKRRRNISCIAAAMHEISICVKLYRLSRQKYQPINLSHEKKR